jgi:hypothetical protein
MSAVASTSKRCAPFSFQPLYSTRGGVGRQQPARRDVSSSTSSGNKNATNNNNNGEEMPELTAFDAVGGLLKASTGGIAVFGLGAVGVIGVASFAANVSKQFIADGGGGKEKTKRELLLDELNELKAEEDTWGNRRRQRKIKGELKKLVDEM